MSSSRGSEKGNLADNILQIVKFWKQLILLIEGTWVASAREGDDSSSSLTTAFKTHHRFIIMSILFRPRLSEKAASLWIPNIHNMFRPLPSWYLILFWQSLIIILTVINIFMACHHFLWIFFMQNLNYSLPMEVEATSLNAWVPLPRPEVAELWFFHCHLTRTYKS